MKCLGNAGGWTLDKDLPRGTGEAEGASRFLLVAVAVAEAVVVAVRGISDLLVVVVVAAVRARPVLPDDFCCSESEVIGAGVLGASGLILGGLPTFLLGGFGVSDLFDITD